MNLAFDLSHGGRIRMTYLVAAEPVFQDGLVMVIKMLVINKLVLILI